MLFSGVYPLLDGNGGRMGIFLMVILLMFTCFFRSGFCVNGNYSFVEFDIYNGTNCSQSEYTVTFYMKFGECIPSGHNPVKFFYFNETHINYTSYTPKTLCTGVANYTVIPVGQCLAFDNVSGIARYTNGLPFSLNGTSIKEWTSLEYFNDDECSVPPAYFDVTSAHKSFRRGRFSSTDLFSTRAYCTDDSLILAYGPPKTGYFFKRDLHFNETDIISYKYYRNLSNDECSVRFGSSFDNPLHVKSAFKNCRTHNEFFNEAELFIESTDFQLEQIYWTEQCDGDPFAFSQLPLKTCNLGEKKYVNWNISQFIQYDDIDCSNDDNINYMEYVYVFPNNTCNPFNPTYVRVSGWGYKMALSDEFSLSNFMAMAVVPNCTYYDSKTLYNKIMERSIGLLFTSEDSCLRNDDWSDFFNLEGKGLRGRCKNGELEAKNYTVKSCENVFNWVPANYCISGADYSFILGCIPFYCDGVSQYNEKVCNGRGECFGIDKCKCYIPDVYYGEFCQYSIYDNVVNQQPSSSIDPKASEAWKVVLGVLIPLLFLVICTLMCFMYFLIVLFIFGIMMFGIVLFCCFGAFSTVFVRLLFLTKKVDKFSQLEGIDILLKEQEVEGSKDKPKFQVKKSLFEIDFEEIVLKKRIGSGGSGAQVYLAMWKAQPVAFKVFKTTFFETVDFEMFEHEVQLMSSLSHPNILRFFGCSLKSPRIGIVMEFCSNGDLKDYIMLTMLDETKKSLPFHEKIRILGEIGGAIDHLHTRSIIHRDLKNENVLLSSALNAKLMDFGLSRIVSSADVSRLTMRIGTSVYMAPEITISGEYTDKVDVFSFGIMMFELLEENFFPYGQDALAGIEVRVAMDPNYRPVVKKEYESDKDWYIDMMKKCWSHDSVERPTFKDICVLFSEMEEKYRKEVEEIEDSDLKDLKKYENSVIKILDGEDRSELVRILKELEDLKKKGSNDDDEKGEKEEEEDEDEEEFDEF